LPYRTLEKYLHGISTAVLTLAAIHNCSNNRGGHDYTWHEIQPDSVNQSKWRGDTTPRSQLLLGTMDKRISLEDTDDDHSIMAFEEKKADIIQVLGKYFSVWEPPPDPLKRIQFLEKIVFPKISYEDIKFSLFCRGKNIEAGSKLDIAEKLYQDITLERKLLGEKAHKSIKALEVQVSSLLKRKKEFLAKKILARIEILWKPLNDAQAQMNVIKASNEQSASMGKNQDDYKNWRCKLLSSHAGWSNISNSKPNANILSEANMYDAHVNISPTLVQSQRVHNPLSDESINVRSDVHIYSSSSLPETIQINGITPRGPSLYTPRSDNYMMAVAAGSNHACALHRSGHVYSWGVNISNRLGLPDQVDVFKPALIKDLEHLKMKAVACGYSHSGALSCDGNVYIWGSTNTGKVGIGNFIEGKECFLLNPTKLILPRTCRNVAKMSCGYAHTALIAENGQLFVFGCGDGGRLGLGSFDTIYTPTLVNCLVHERIADVSCGNCSTLVSTHIFDTQDDEHSVQSSFSQTHGSSGGGSKLEGGRVYVAGSSFVLGKDYKSFTLLNCIQNTPIIQVSAGYRHSCLVSMSGELLCWGNNVGGCCGVSISETFVQEPRVVKAMHYQAENLAYKAKCYQSSTFRERHASYAVDGGKDGSGLSACSCTTEESHAWIEVDLGFEAIIDEILIWNRSDSPNIEVGGLPRDFFTSRLFPMWVMISSHEFDTGVTLFSYQKNLSTATAKKKFEENKRLSKWRCTGVQGRFVRIQLEEYNFLNIAEIEVFGRPRLSPGVGRVGAVTAGRDCTVAVIRPTMNPLDAEKAYKRAVYSDAQSADILRQLPTYAAIYDRLGKDLCHRKCPICTKKTVCEICRLYNEYEAEFLRKCVKADGLSKIADSLLQDMNIAIVSDDKPKNEKNQRMPQKRLPDILRNLTKYL
jgi:alpha-tubulin suppressor-like RCC1 family protein